MRIMRNPNDYAVELLEWYNGDAMAATKAFMEEVNTPKNLMPNDWALAVLHRVTQPEEEDVKTTDFVGITATGEGR